MTRSQYPTQLNQPLGRFLQRLKLGHDNFYLKFLNKCGDLVYCDFSIAEHTNARGLYYYAVRGEIKYIGRCCDSFGKRINQGYGHLSAKNCYRDGQVTNCRLNALIAQHQRQITLYLCSKLDDERLIALERTLIEQEKPEWNQ